MCYNILAFVDLKISLFREDKNELIIIISQVVLTALINVTTVHYNSGGLEAESEYPYEGADEKCKFKKSEAVVYINSSVAISKDENSK